MQATAFVAHPYQIPTVGWPADIQGWKIEDLQKFFKTNYAPNNCTLILVGDLSAPKKVSRWRRNTWSPSRGRSRRRRCAPPSPSSSARSACSCERDAQTPLLYYAYKSPAANDPQGPAINLLMSVLTEGDSSRLHRLLVEEKKLAIEVDGYFQEGFDPGLTWLQLTLPEGAKVGEVEKVLDAALDQVVAQGVTDAELARAKNLYASSFWKQLATINGKASLLGQFEVFEGDYRKLFDSPAAYDKVTREDVQKAAALVFQKNRRTVGVLEAEAHEAPRAAKAKPWRAASPRCCCAEPALSARRDRAPTVPPRRREGAGQPAFRAAERPDHRAGAAKRTCR